MSPRFVLGRENVPCVAEVVSRSLKADCTDFTMAWNFCKDTKLKTLFTEIENHKDKKMQPSKVIFPLTMSHVIIKIPNEEHKKNFFVQKFINFFVKKLFA